MLESQLFKLQKSFSATPVFWHPRTLLKNGFLLLWLLTDLDCSCPWCFVCVFSLSLASETQLDRVERRLIWPLHTAFSLSPCSSSLWVTSSVCFKSLSICSGRQHPIIYSKFVLNWAAHVCTLCSSFSCFWVALYSSVFFFFVYLKKIYRYFHNKVKTIINLGLAFSADNSVIKDVCFTNRKRIFKLWNCRKLIKNTSVWCHGFNRSPSCKFWLCYCLQSKF